MSSIQVNEPLHASISTLPYEVLTEILLLSGIQIDVTVHPERKRCTYNSKPALYQLVCRAWRELVVSGKIFWAQLHISLFVHDGWERFPGSDNIRSGLECVSRLLERSGAAPLSLTIDPSPSVTASLVNKCTKRIRRLTLGLGRTCMDILDLSFPILESITLHIAAHSSRSMHQMAVLDAPNLQEAYIHSFMSDLIIELPWRQLRGLEYIATLLSDVLDVVSKCTSLMDCKFRFFSSRPLEGPLPFVSSNLTSLSFCPYDPGEAESMSHCFEHLTLPCLTSLTISHYSGEWSHDLANSLTSFLERSKCSIQTLNLEKSNVRHDTPVLLLGHLPTLTHFILSESEHQEEGAISGSRPLVNDILDHISPTTPSELQHWHASSSLSSLLQQGYTSILPRVETIELEGRCDPTEFSLQKFLEMVSARWDARESEPM
jgi:hypothetical protein